MILTLEDELGLALVPAVVLSQQGGTKAFRRLDKQDESLLDGKGV